MSSEHDPQARVQAVKELVAQHYWAADFKDAFLPEYLANAAAAPLPDFSDAKVRAFIIKDPPTPPQVDGVHFYDRVINITHPDGSTYDLTIRVYKPTGDGVPQQQQAAFVLLHGGGMCLGDLNTEHPRCLYLTREVGAVGISVAYRLVPEHKPSVLLEDCYAALKWVTDNAGKDADLVNVDPRRIAVTGASAGGCLSFSMAQMARDRGDTKPLLQIAMYPGADDRTPERFRSRHTEFPLLPRVLMDQMVGTWHENGPLPKYFMPNYTEDLKGLCPAIVVAAGNDVVRDEAIEYSWRMIRDNVPTALHVIPGVGHGFDLKAPECAATKLAWKLTSDAFKQALNELV